MPEQFRASTTHPGQQCDHIVRPTLLLLAVGLFALVNAQDQRGRRLNNKVPISAPVRWNLDVRTMAQAAPTVFDPAKILSRMRGGH